MKRVGLVTCRVLPEPDPDEHLLLAGLAEAGVRAELVAWDDPDADAGDFDACILRSCWNYFEQPDAFLDWIDRVSRRTRLFNPPDVVRDNIHKRYLERLDRSGVPIYPTAWVERGKRVDLAETMATRGWGDVVVKPSISAGSYRTRRFRAAECAAGQAFLDSLLAERDAMIQKFMAGVDASGERAIVWIDGEVTHAVRKNPRFSGQDESVSEALPVSEAERELVVRALDHAGADVLYARADLVDDAGTLRLSELELIEPSLFIKQSPAALSRLVDAVARL